MKIRRCHVCKCTETSACPGRCWWIGQDLCSSCGPRAARHLRERVPLRQPRKFYWLRRVDVELGLVTWCLRWIVAGKAHGFDVCKDILEIQADGRSLAASILRRARFAERIRVADLRRTTQQKAYSA